MPIRVLALDLERTLISDALHREPRPGLREFLLFCCERFERVTLFTSVNKQHAFAALQQCAETGDVPQKFLDKLEFVEWEGKYKDLRFVPNASLSEILLIDDDGGWVRPEQQAQWVGIAEYDPYLVKGEDQEFVRVRHILDEKVQRAARTQGKDIAVFLLENVQQQLCQDVLPETEANLLQAINVPLAPEIRQQRDALLALQKQRELTEAEQETRTQLIDAVELANAKRWQSLAELAERRGLSLAEIAHELEIPLS